MSAKTAAAAAAAAPSARPGTGSIPYEGGTTFRVWAPNASEVFVIGDFNDWSESSHPLARDGEGATRLVSVRIQGARSDAEAERAARRVANSPLVKTAVFGGDPNWGRILQTIGAARVAVDPARVEVRLG